MSKTSSASEFVDRFLADCRAEALARDRASGLALGLAEMILRVLAARGIPVPDRTREQVLSCTDTGQLEAWGDRAATAVTFQEVFGG